MSNPGVGVSNPLFFVGVVENNVDPRREGRVQVRAFGVHGFSNGVNGGGLETDELPWAIVVKGDYDPNGSPGLGLPAINSWVFGMFLDGRDAQQPMILGLIPTQNVEAIDPFKNGWGYIPNTSDAELIARGSDPDNFGEVQQSRLARGERLTETHVHKHQATRTTGIKIGGKDKTWSEPPSAYKAQYPHNRVIESGAHTIELDDTPGAERITIFHRAGAYVQIDHRGTTTHKATGDKYEVNDRNHHVVVGGMSTVTVNGNSYVYVKGNKIEEIEGDLTTMVHGNHHLNVGGEITHQSGDRLQIRAGADVRMTSLKATSINVGTELQVQSGQSAYFKTPKAWFQATDSLSIKANTTLFESVESLDIFSDKINMQGTSDFNIRGDAVLRVGSDGNIHVNATEVFIDDYVTMANGGAEGAGSALSAEDAIDAVKVEAPEPTAKSTSIVANDPPSLASSGPVYEVQDPNAESSVTATIPGNVTAVVESAASPLLDFIGNKESNGYDDIWGGIRNPRHRPSKPLTSMTIQEVLDWQESIDAIYNSEAAGRYQIMEDTLRGYNNDKGGKTGKSLYERAGLSAGDLFSPINQDKMAVVLLEGRGLTSFLDGKITREQFANNLASEWASLPLVTGPGAGQSKYAGDGLNRSLTSIQEFLSVIDQVKAKEQAIISGGAG